VALKHSRNGPGQENRSPSSEADTFSPKYIRESNPLQAYDLAGPVYRAAAETRAVFDVRRKKYLNVVAECSKMPSVHQAHGQEPDVA
jgi:hypothetical protein